MVTVSNDAVIFLYNMKHYTSFKQKMIKKYHYTDTYIINI